MGSEISCIMPRLYVGGLKNARDAESLDKLGVTHVVSVHDNAEELNDGRTYLCIRASDSADTDLSKHFSRVAEFIASARQNEGCVLVHCLAGVSRSVTLTVVYIMLISNLGWIDALKVVRVARPEANPNFGFKRQLSEFEKTMLEKERQRLHNLALLPELTSEDVAHCQKAVKDFATTIYHGQPLAETHDTWLFERLWARSGESEPTEIEGSQPQSEEPRLPTSDKPLETDV